jgi:ribosomal protein L18
MYPLNVLDAAIADTRGYSIAERKISHFVTTAIFGRAKAKKSPGAVEAAGAVGAVAGAQSISRIRG